MHEVLEVGVDRPREVHHVAGVAVGDDGQHEQLVGDLPPGPVGDPERADEVHVERQVRPVLLDGAAGHEADLAQLDGVVDLGPGQLLVAVFRAGSAVHRGRPLGRKEDAIRFREGLEPIRRSGEMGRGTPAALDRRLPRGVGVR